MDWGAAAHEKNGANNLAKQDRDQPKLQPIPQPNWNSKKSENKLCRRTNAKKSAGRPLTPQTLSGMEIRFCDAPRRRVAQPGQLRQLSGQGDGARTRDSHSPNRTIITSAPVSNIPTDSTSR